MKHCSGPLCKHKGPYEYTLIPDTWDCCAQCYDHALNAATSDIAKWRTQRKIAAALGHDPRLVLLGSMPDRIAKAIQSVIDHSQKLHKEQQARITAAHKEAYADIRSKGIDPTDPSVKIAPRKTPKPQKATTPKAPKPTLSKEEVTRLRIANLQASVEVRRSMYKKKWEDRLGTRFGQRVVTGRIHDKKDLVEVRCDCGDIGKASWRELVKGRASKCAQCYYRSLRAVAA